MEKGTKSAQKAAGGKHGAKRQVCSKGTSRDTQKLSEEVVHLEVVFRTELKPPHVLPGELLELAQAPRRDPTATARPVRDTRG